MNATKTKKSDAEITKPQNATELRTIKKYPNRRLYDTATSSYITLADVKTLVIAAAAFTVVDAKSGEDLTRSILLQIILEAEMGGVPMFSETMLAGIIRYYGQATQGFMGNYLEHNLNAFNDFQSNLNAKNTPFSPELWTQWMQDAKPTDWAMQSQNALGEMQKSMLEQMNTLFGLKK